MMVAQCSLQKATAWSAGRTASPAAPGIARCASTTWEKRATCVWAGALLAVNLGGGGKLRFACRATSAAELNAPVGYDKHSYGYRSGGDKVNQGRREPYGTAFREGDVVGLYMYAGPRLATDDKVWHSGSSV